MQLRSDDKFPMTIARVLSGFNRISYLLVTNQETSLFLPQSVIQRTTLLVCATLCYFLVTNIFSEEPEDAPLD
jgi:hypothetical protein